MQDNTGNTEAGEILDLAFFRSFRRTFPQWSNDLPERSISVVICGGASGPDIIRPAKKGKLLVFGTPADDACGALGLAKDNSLPALSGKDACPVCEGGRRHAESEGRIIWSGHALAQDLGAALRVRPFTRFDFTDEWNNLGYGRIATDGSIWAAGGGMRAAGPVELAAIYLRDDSGNPVYAGSYMTLLDLPDASVLWCARPVGPVDSTEWSVIENFVSNWRPGELACWPCLRQTPRGCNAVVTMRLDCDEDIASARDVFDWYAGEGLPFSLAVKTCLPMRPEDLSMLRDVHAAGGSLLSHSHLHACGWGDSYEAALADAVASRQWFRDNLPDIPVPAAAVSPFHSNPPYAVRAVRDAGFSGMVSGIIHNDPACLLGRAGRVPHAGGRLLSISQQSMLHGDSYAAQKGIDTHVEAFKLQYAARGFFGYLDHPFSSRYQYGWESRAQRLAAHRELAERLRSHPGVLFWSQNQCFDYLGLLDGITFSVNGDNAEAFCRGAMGGNRPVYSFCGEEHAL